MGVKRNTEQRIEIRLHAQYKEALKGVLAGDWLFNPAQMRERLNGYRRDGITDAEFSGALQQAYVEAVGTEDGPDGFILWFDPAQRLWKAAARDVMAGLWGAEWRRVQSERLDAVDEGTPESKALWLESLTRETTFRLITTALLKNDEWRESVSPEVLEKMRGQVAYTIEGKATAPFRLPVTIGAEVVCYAVFSPDDRLSIEGGQS
jgi:hypothetical protein